MLFFPFQAGPIARGMMKVMPVFLFPIAMNFPAVIFQVSLVLVNFAQIIVLFVAPQAITFYWLTTNLVSVE